VGPRFLYCHGFASGPASKKGVALAAHLAGRGARLELLDLRVPSFERLRLSEMLGVIRRAIGGPDERVVLLGSSLGALASARVAEEDARACALVLLAPAFRLGERWRARLAPDELARWRASGWLEVWDHASAAPGRVDHGFLEDLEALDARGGGWPDVRVPTLVIHGLRDDTVSPETSRAWAAGKRHVHLVEVDDVHELVASLPVIQRELDAFLAPFLGKMEP
jgi:alpha-beta hydrolase superfamily lysophospholipase